MRLEAVGKRYGLRQPWIVRNVSLTVPTGRLIRLEGRNGSGKSTLLRVLAGACVPSAGQVTGRPRTGYVPERFPPGLPFSPRVYLTHLGEVHGMSRTSLAGRVEECLERLGAAEYAAAPMRSLSKGMCQKVAVAQALLPRPGLLVLDEAWTGLDQPAREVLDGEVAQRLADGGTVIFVDHDSQRLAGLVFERWRVSGGRVEVLPGDEPVPVPEGRPGVVVIEVSGVGTAARSDLAARPGLVSVRRARESPSSAGVSHAGESRPGAGDPTGTAGERLLVSVEPGESDAVLRALLAAGDDVHVWSVRAAEETR